MVVIVSLIVVFFGILIVVYLFEFSDEEIVCLIWFVIDILSGVLLIIVGVFVYSLLVLFMGKFLVFAGGVVLLVLMLFIIIKVIDEVL